MRRPLLCPRPSSDDRLRRLESCGTGVSAALHVLHASLVGVTTKDVRLDTPCSERCMVHPLSITPCPCTAITREHIPEHGRSCHAEVNLCCRPVRNVVKLYACIAPYTEFPFTGF